MSAVIQPEGWAKPSGYANGIVATGKTLFVGGQVGWNPRSATPEFPATFVEQFDQVLSNICEIVHAAGARPEQIVRMTVYVTDKQEYLGSLKACGAAWKKHLGRHYPAMALVVVASLVEPGAKVEIEATAVLES
jgi:enamine deaminase RidA (YjgF/YER057c/UK114 family)